MQKPPAYVIISWVFLILIGIGFAYSYFFYPDQHPLNCVIKSYTGKSCPSCGFSRSFSYYSHFQFEQGRAFNPLSWRVFLFFGCQALARLMVLVAWYKSKKIAQAVIIGDVITSISFFLLAFLPLIQTA